jgi:hypothetical protein
MSDATDLSPEIVPVKPQQTEAMRNFETNVGLLVAFLNRLKPEDILRSAKSAIRVFARYKDDPKDIKPLERAVTKLTDLTSECQRSGRFRRMDERDARDVYGSLFRRRLNRFACQKPKPTKRRPANSAE